MYDFWTLIDGLNFFHLSFIYLSSHLLIHQFHVSKISMFILLKHDHHFKLLYSNFVNLVLYFDFQKIFFTAASGAELLLFKSLDVVRFLGDAAFDRQRRSKQLVSTS